MARLEDEQGAQRREVCRDGGPQPDRPRRREGDRALTSAIAEHALGRLLRARGPGLRTVLGLAGTPGAGKSTLAAALVEQARDAGRSAVLVPMDGFHLAQHVLDDRGLADVKGAPETFDAAGYVALLRRIRERGPRTVWAPSFDRDLEEPVAGSVAVPAAIDLVVTEGNYLLLGGRWSGVRPLLDAGWFVEPPDEDVRRARLVARHQEFGADPERAHQRALGSDERNARLVRGTRTRADLIVRCD